MRTRLLLAAVCMLTLPFCFSASQADKLTSSAPFATVAYAGHTTAGDWCECGTPGCIPDQGEICNNGARASDDQKDSILGSPAGSAMNPGAGLLMLALAFFLWTRLRA